MNICIIRAYLDHYKIGINDKYVGVLGGGAEFLGGHPGLRLGIAGEKFTTLGGCPIAVVHHCQGKTGVSLPDHGGTRAIIVGMGRGFHCRGQARAFNIMRRVGIGCHPRS